MPLRLKKNDTVMIVSGDNKGQTGRIIKVLTKKNRALVEAKNMVKRHTKPGRKVQQGGIIEKEASIHISNVMLFTKEGKQSRVRMNVVNGKDNQRVLKKSGEVCQ